MLHVSCAQGYALPLTKHTLTYTCKVHVHLRVIATACICQSIRQMRKYVTGSDRLAAVQMFPVYITNLGPMGVPSSGSTRSSQDQCSTAGQSNLTADSDGALCNL